ncbi:MAG TPA: PilZ domain-containing protein [Polyangiaceae bacterium]|nr:PilZ domain-containing protein [Polyangiaceae bacterium]
MRFRSIYQRPRPSRHTVKIPCQVVRERDFRLVADEIADLSVTGMLVVPADPVLTGERLIVSFQTPVWGIWIDAEATVARVVHGRRPGEFSRALGLRFDGIDPWARYVIERNLRGLPPIPPGSWRHRGDSALAVERLARGSGSQARPVVH